MIIPDLILFWQVHMQEMFQSKQHQEVSQYTEISIISVFVSQVYRVKALFRNIRPVFFLIMSYDGYGHGETG